jgi:hypothetical protein
MAEKNALDVLNRMAEEGTIGKYAIAGDQVAWTEIDPILTECVDVLIAMPPTSDSPDSDMARILAILEKEGYSEFGEYGLKIEGWDIRFAVCANDLAGEALDQAIERNLLIPHSKRSVQARILRPEHFAALMLQSNTAKDRYWIACLVEDEEVDLDALRDVIARYDLERAWSGLCKLEGI